MQYLSPPPPATVPVYLSMYTASPSLPIVTHRVLENKSKTFIVRDKSMTFRKQ